MAKKYQIHGKFGGNGMPTKLSDLENDLFYPAIYEEFITLTPDDFTPQYCLDDEGNPTDEVEYYFYEGNSRLDWFTSADSIAYVVHVEGDTLTHNYPVENVTTGEPFNDDEFLFYKEDEDINARFIACKECGIFITNGLKHDQNPADVHTVIVFGNVRFDSIIIYRVKRTSEENSEQYGGAR